MKILITTDRLNKYREGKIYDVNSVVAENLIQQGEAEHQKEKIVRNPLLCPYCNFIAKSKAGLKRHTCIRPLISVIIPSRMDEEITSLHSIKTQTYQNLEIIIEYDKKRKGAGATRNKGICRAKGQYIFFCDNDIELYEDAIEVLYKAIKDTDYYWAFGKFYIDNSLFNEKKKEKSDDKNYIDYFQGISVCSLVKTSAKPEFDETMIRYEDWDLWITLDKNGYKGKFVDKILFFTYKHRPDREPVQKENSHKWIKILHAKHGAKIADIVIPHHDRHDLLKQCLEYLDNTLFNIIVVSGGSFAYNCNQGAKAARTDNIIFLNDDTIPDNDILKEMAWNDNITGVAQKTRDTIFYGLFYDNKLMAALNYEDVQFPSGFCFKVKKNVWEELGEFNEEFKNGCEDIEWFLRALENNYEFSYVTKPIQHLQGESEGRYDDEDANRKLLKIMYPHYKIKKLCGKKKKWNK